MVFDKSYILCYNRINNSKIRKEHPYEQKTFTSFLACAYVVQPDRTSGVGCRKYVSERFYL